MNVISLLQRMIFRVFNEFCRLVVLVEMCGPAVWYLLDVHLTGGPVLRRLRRRHPNHRIWN